MYKLEPNDIQGMLSEAARVLTQPKDREIMRRLVSFARVSPSTEWDRRLIAAMLAKAGKMHEAELVINDIESRWERADAWCSAAKAVFETDDKAQAIELLHVAVMEGSKAQIEGTDQDAQSAAGVMADVAEVYAQQNDFAAAEKVASEITHHVRRERALERVKELRGDTGEAEAEAGAAAEGDSSEGSAKEEQSAQ